jgi:[ribosomal protein S5]-alanine N-acetyltransferase
LAGATFVLRAFRVDDFDAALDLGESGEAEVDVPDLPAADAGAVAEFFETSRAEGEMLHLVIADAVSDSYLGEVTLVIAEDRVGELGCGLIRPARGRGVATEALQLLAGWALDVLHLGRLQVFVAEQNVAALRLAERAGFRREGLLRAYWERGPGRVDAVVLSLLPGDLPQRP